MEVGAWILAGIVLAGGAAKYVKGAWDWFHRPAHEAKAAAKEGDESLRSQMEEALRDHKRYEEYFRNDSNDIKLIKHELMRQGAVDAATVEGVYLIIQHLTTGNHTDEMKKWMRDFVSNETESHIEERTTS